VVSALLDFLFTEFVTTRLVKAIYVLAVVLGGVLGLGGVAYALSRSLHTGLLVALVAGSGFAVFVLAVRIWLEALLVFFRLADHTAEMLEHEAAIALNMADASPFDRRTPRAIPASSLFSAISNRIPPTAASLFWILVQLLGACTGERSPTAPAVVEILITTSVGSGTSVIVDGDTTAAPARRHWDAGSTHQIGVPQFQNAGTGMRHAFQGWSDGGARIHDVLVPKTATTYTATLAFQQKTVSIVSPLDFTNVDEGSHVELHGVATDFESNRLPSSTLHWLSDIDGPLGNGDPVVVSTLSIGTHWIVLQATDSDGDGQRDSVTLLVEPIPTRIDRPLTPEDVAARFVVGQIGIKYKAGAISADQIAALNRSYGIKSQILAPDLGFYIGLVDLDALGTEDLANNLQSDPRIDFAVGNVLLGPTAKSEATANSSQHYLRLTGIDLLWQRLKSQGIANPGQGVKIAIIDDGLDFTNPDFSAPSKIVSPAYISGVLGTIQTSEAAVQSVGHGTFVASIAAGDDDSDDSFTGVAPGATLIPVRVGESNLNYFTAWNVARGIVYAREVGAGVINISLGFHFDTPSPVPSWIKAVMLGPMTDALDAGVQIVVASGNCGLDFGDVDHPGQVTPRLWVVGGTNVVGDDIFTDIPDPEGECPSKVGQSQGGPSLDFVAPGQDLSASGPDGSSVSGTGTSGSAPIVAGLIALHLSAGVDRGAIPLALDVIDLGPDGRDDRTGSGRVVAGIELESATPSFVAAGQTTRVLLHGRNFDRKAQVVINGVPQGPVSVDYSKGDLVFEVTAASGTQSLDVKVRHPSLFVSGLGSNTLSLDVYNAPMVTTATASSIAATSATLNGAVNPNGSTTTAWFEWGTSPSLPTFTSTPPQSVGFGTTAVPVTAVLTGLGGSSAYYYRAAASNRAGTSKGSILSFATTDAPPAAPSNLTAAPISSTQIDLAWTDNSTNEDGFRVERTPSGTANFSEVATVAANVAAYQDAELAAGTSYDYRIHAYNVAGASAYSNTATATTSRVSSVVFTVQPGNMTAGAPITPAVQVTARDALGNPATSFTGNVTVAIGTNPGGGTLSGTTTVAAVAGVATFSDLSIDKSATAYTLVASAAGLSGATSVPFTITAGAATQLVFTVQPSNTTARAPITPAVQVTARDALGNPATSFTGDVTVAIGTNPGGGTLSGTTTVAAVAGVATFSDLSIDKSATGYTLVASAAGLSGATSAAFTVEALTLPAAPSFDAGNAVTCGIASDGAAYCWGVTSGVTPAIVPGNVAFQSLSVGGFHRCGVATGGAAFCWGTNTFGQLGNGAQWIMDPSTPVLVSGGLSFHSVSAGGTHTCGVTTGGAVYCWGNNIGGQLGAPTAEFCGIFPCSTTPVSVSGGRAFQSVSGGGLHTCGLTTAGAAYCWGNNDNGQLGDGTTLTRSTPVPVAAELTFRSVTAGDTHTCGVTTGGAVYCWGANESGQLGDGTTVGRTTPVPVAGGLTFRSVSAGGTHTCGVTTGGAAYCWGGNGNEFRRFGQLGDGSVTDSAVPVPVTGGLTFESVSAGKVHTCGVTAGGAAHCWGHNEDGELGNGAWGAVTVPGPVGGGLVLQSVGASIANPRTAFACALTTGGAAYCWGFNGFGYLGTGSDISTSTPAPVAGGLTFQSVSVGGGHTCGVTTGGAAYCWGGNGSGQLGDGTNVDRWAPVPVTGGPTFQSVSAGGGHTCGVTTGGAAYCWGANGSGQRGDGTTVRRTTPTPVVGGLTFQSVSAGGSHTCGVTTGGAAYCWGANGSGQLGDGTVTNSTAPVPVTGGLTFRSVSAGVSHTCGVTTGGTAYCWGANGSGQLGDGTVSNSMPPVPVTRGLMFQTVSAGASHTCGVTTGGAGSCWGANESGQRGDGTVTNSMVPVPVTSGLTFQAVSAGASHTCGVTTTGAGHCWGDNQREQLGNGTRSGSGVPVPVVGGITFR
jgi:alpha-tubulin suppressor-like RCC1 family protein